uniref:hexokinase-2-like n=1 Tax=Styela clava TaxID=7725 RepID=UPI00193A1E7E|nr:hexokinase-2-like [Styela clava]
MATVDQQQKHLDLKSALATLTLSDETLHVVKGRVSEALSKGLTKEYNNDSSLKMLPTYVRDTPDGTEGGDFLALDLGGTNFRVLRVQIDKEDEGKVHMDNQVYKMPQDVMTGSGEELFDYIAESIGNFLEVYDLKNVKLPLGFTFSFPCVQEGLDRGSLLRWTKGFSASGVVGNDVVQLLQEAVGRMEEEYELEVVALVNDTVGTMMSCGHEDHDCVIGMIVGTGTNACYMEKTGNVEALSEEDRGDGEGQMCINTEWGAFGERGELEDIVTEYDRAVDQRSINPGCMIYEKMISGMYMGEVVRNILVDLVQSGSILGGHLTEKLNTFGDFETAFVTQIELDHSPKLRMAAQVLRHLGYDSEDLNIQKPPGHDYPENCTLADRQAVREVCEAVSTRAAHLCASGVAALLERIMKNRESSGVIDARNMTVGVDGTVYKKHPHFRRLLESKVRDLLPVDTRVTFRMSHDGSGKGAALVTAVACRMSGIVSKQLGSVETHLGPS